MKGERAEYCHIFYSLNWLNSIFFFFKSATLYVIKKIMGPKTFTPMLDAQGVFILYLFFSSI